MVFQATLRVLDSYSKAGIPPGKSDASGGIGPKNIVTLISVFFGQMPPDASDFPGGIPALADSYLEKYNTIRDDFFEAHLTRTPANIGHCLHE